MHEVCAGFSLVVRSGDEMREATEQLLATGQRALTQEQTAASSDVFGPPDDRSGARLVEEIQMRLSAEPRDGDKKCLRSTSQYV